MISTKEVAKLLGVSPQYIRILCAAEKIRAIKTGRDWVIIENESQLKIKFKRRK